MSEHRTITAAAQIERLQQALDKIRDEYRKHDVAPDGLPPRYRTEYQMGALYALDMSEQWLEEALVDSKEDMQ